MKMKDYVIKELETSLNYYFNNIIKNFESIKNYLDNLPEIPFKKKDIIISLPIYQLDLSTISKDQEFDCVNKITPTYLNVRLIKSLLSKMKLNNIMLDYVKNEILDDILKDTINKLSIQTINYILENNLADKNFIFMIEKKENKNLDETELILEGWELKEVDESNIDIVISKLREEIKNILFIYFQKYICVHSLL